MAESQRPFVLRPPLSGGEARAKRAEGPGVAVLILGICAFIPFLGLICGLVALLLGIGVLGKKTSRKGMAVAGLTLGGIGVFLNLVAVVSVVPVYLYSRGPIRRLKFRRLKCEINLQTIRMAALTYYFEKIQENDAPPPDLDVLVDEGMLPREALTCPVADSGRTCDYFYLHPKEGILAPDGTMIACDLKDNHAGEGRNVCYSDGNGEWLSEDKFQRKLNLPENAKFAAALRAAE